MDTTSITFGSALQGPENAALRDRVAALVPERAHPLLVSSVLEMVEDLDRQSSEPSPSWFLLFDLHRLVLYNRPVSADSAGVSDLIRHLVDGYPSQPFDLLQRHFADHAFRFLYPLESLDILGHLWSSQKPGAVTVLNLDTAEIEVADVQPHPESPPIQRTAASGIATPKESRRLEDRWTDASLRQRSVVGLTEQVSTSAGVVRTQRTVRDAMSLPFASTMVSWDQGHKQEFCFGKSARADQASAVALCEALERFQVAFHKPGEEMVFGSYAALADDAVDPRELFFGRCPGCDDDHLPVYTDEASLYWTWADHALGGAALVPAQEIWFNTLRLPGEQRFIRPTTNGCALGTSVEEAALHGLLEAIERDGYLTMWYLKRRCDRIDPDSIEDEAFQIFRRRWQLAFSDYDFQLFDITTDIAVPTVAAVAVRRRGDGPRTFHGAAAHLSAERACLGALQDISGFTPDRLSAERRAQLRRLLEKPDGIVGPTGHFELYALDETFERLEFLGLDDARQIDVRDIDRRSLIPLQDRYNLRTVFERVAEHLEPLGVSVYFKDITHPALASNGLRCAKAVTPGLYPIWFGHRARRFAPTERLRRLARELGADTGVDCDDWNLEVHPFA